MLDVDYRSLPKYLHVIFFKIQLGIELRSYLQDIAEPSGESMETYLLPNRKNMPFEESFENSW